MPSSADQREHQRQWEDLSIEDKIRAVLQAAADPLTRDQILLYCNIRYDQLPANKQAEVNAFFLNNNCVDFTLAEIPLYWLEKADDELVLMGQFQMAIYNMASLNLD